MNANNAGQDLRERLWAESQNFGLHPDVRALLQEADAELAALTAAQGEAVAYRYRDASQFDDNDWRYLDLRPLNTYAEVQPLYTIASSTPPKHWPPHDSAECKVCHPPQGDEGAIPNTITLKELAARRSPERQAAVDAARPIARQAIADLKAAQPAPVTDAIALECWADRLDLIERQGEAVCKVRWAIPDPEFHWLRPELINDGAIYLLYALPPTHTPAGERK